MPTNDSFSSPLVKSKLICSWDLDKSIHRKTRTLYDRVWHEITVTNPDTCRANDCGGFCVLLSYVSMRIDLWLIRIFHFSFPEKVLLNKKGNKSLSIVFSFDKKGFHTILKQLARWSSFKDLFHLVELALLFMLLHAF